MTAEERATQATIPGKADALARANGRIPPTPAELELRKATFGKTPSMSPEQRSVTGKTTGMTVLKRPPEKIVGDSLGDGTSEVFRVELRPRERLNP